LIWANFLRKSTIHPLGDLAKSLLIVMATTSSSSQAPHIEAKPPSPSSTIKPSRTFVLATLVLEVALCFFYGFFTDYDQEALPTGATTNENVRQFYGTFQDVHVMIFIGFGFLMTFLHAYSWSSLGYTMFLGALAIQTSILINGFFHRVFDDDEPWEAIDLSIEKLITGDFAAGAVLVAFGAVLGKTTPLQMLVMLLCFLVFYAVNESLGVVVYEAVDMGGSMFVHAFGAYFGLAASWALGYIPSERSSEKEKATYFSDITATIGTVFLWMFWPSFNGALAPGNSQERVIINTLLALTGSCITAILASMWLSKQGKISMVHFQNATLAGGVAVGSSADLVIGPHGALVVGAIAGILSVIGYTYISPWLDHRLSIHDTCGVHNLHGMPGLVGGLGGIISAATAGNSAYGDAIGDIFPARDQSSSDPRSASSQALFQLAALGTTLGIAILGGYLTGRLMRRLPTKKTPMEDEEWDKEA